MRGWHKYSLYIGIKGKKKRKKRIFSEPLETLKRLIYNTREENSLASYSLTSY